MRRGTVLSSRQTFSTTRVARAARPARRLAGPGPDRPDRHRAARGQWIVPAAGGGRELVVVQALRAPVRCDEPQQRLLLLQAASLDAADAILNQLRLYLVLGLLIGTVVGVLAGLALTRAVLRPLDRMARTAEAIAGGDLNRRLRLPPGRNEVARLGGAFDHMVDRLAATLQAQRRFIADASHELRTPLTSLEGLSEMLLIGADRGDSRTIQRTRALDARRIGPDGAAGRRSAHALAPGQCRADVVRPRRSREAAGRCGRAGGPAWPKPGMIRLEVTHDGPIPVRADADRLKQVLLNLVDNALRYTPPEGDGPASGGAGPGGRRGAHRRAG